MAHRTPIESGAPDNKPFMHPTLLKNYGNWRYHDRPRPGVLHHVSHSGDEVWTVRAATQRQMDVHTIRKLCDIADTYADGHVRFTIRSNIEFMVADENKVAPLISALQESGFPVGGTGNSVSAISHTQGWLHCDIPGTDASGGVKALMDELYHEFVHEEMPNRVHISTSCCEINCGGQADIAIIIQHTKPPKINHDLVANVCESAPPAAQISPGKNANCRCTSAAFTVGGVAVGFAVVCQLASPPSAFYAVRVPRVAPLALGLPSGKSSRACPCRRLVVKLAHDE